MLGGKLWWKADAGASTAFYCQRSGRICRIDMHACGDNVSRTRLEGAENVDEGVLELN